MTAPSYTKLPPFFTTPPPPVPNVLITFPVSHVLLVTLNRPKQLNAIPPRQHFALEQLWDWYDAEPTLRCAVLTGTGRAFCAGADLKAWDNSNNNNSDDGGERKGGGFNSRRSPKSGFGGMSNRGGKKPILAAVNGICFGGGMEMAINCDMVIAAAAAEFALPEVTIGVIALAGALPRLIRSVGRQRASEMALSGKRYSAQEMLGWGLVNEVVTDDEGKNAKDGHGGGGAGGSAVVKAALRWAERIAGNSPDAVFVSREGLKLGWEAVGPELGTDIVMKGLFGRMEGGENMVEGVRSFVERRKPVWKDSKL